jgi:dolichyl-phosphate beta-glucosyltransferase
MSRIVVIIPVYNYASQIDQSLKALAQWKARHIEHQIEIIFSDDGSTDESAQHVRSFLTTQGQGWTLITHDKNTGKGAAIRRGLTKAKSLSADTIVFCDCDLYYGLNIIFDRLTVALVDADIAIVDRSWRRDRVKASPLRTLASAIFNRSVSILTGVALRDTQAGLKAFRANSCWPVFDLLTIDGFTFDVEILSIALFYRLRIKQIPIEVSKLSSATTVSILRSSLAMIVDLFRININWKTGRYSQSQLISRIESDVYVVKD